MILIDGRPGTYIQALDRGLQYGHGVFETIAVMDARPLCLDAHLHRLAVGCRTLGLPEPDMGALAAESAHIVADQSRAVLKIIVTGGVGGRGYQSPPEPMPARIVSVPPWPEYPANYRTEGINAVFCQFTLAQQPALAGIKHLNRLEQVLARNEIAGTGCPEGIVADTSGAIIEGTMSNIFLRRGELLLTPDLRQCGVNGIIRQEILKRADSIGLEASVRRIERAEILAADEIFFTNSIIGVWPVRGVGDHTFGATAVAQRLAQILLEADCITPP